MITTSNFAHTLQDTLDGIIDDDDGIQSKVVFPRYMDVGEMDGAIRDELEVEGPGLVAEKPEGTEIQLGSIREGWLKRYTPGTYALKLNITRECIDDCKYPDAIKGARRLKKAMWTTADVDAALTFVRAWNTDYIGADGVCLANASHPISGGSLSGTYSNTLAVPMSPSIQALINVRAAVNQLPGHNGIISPLEAEKVVFPIAQRSVWDVLLGSDKNPEPGQFNAINIARKMDMTPIPVHHWNNTTTNWGVITDADDGLKWFWRKRPESMSWQENNYLTMKYAIYARWARGWTDPRCFFGSEM